MERKSELFSNLLLVTYLNQEYYIVLKVYVLLYVCYRKCLILGALQGKFRWTFRSRIRVTLIGENIFRPPVELHDQQLLHPEYRYISTDR